MNSKNIRVLMYALFDQNNIQAQSRDALNWSIHLDPEVYTITAFSKGFIDERVNSLSHIKIIKVSNNKYLRHLRMMISLINPRYDYIILSMPSINISIYLWLVGRVKSLSKRIIISLVNRLPYPESYANLMYSKKFNQFAISRKIKDDFNKITNREIPIVHLAYDTQIFTPSTSMPREKKILCVGSMQLRKNPFLFSAVARKLPDYEFIWVGNGYYYSWIQARKHNNKLENLTLIKELNQTKLAQLMRNCSIFVLPSVHEGFPNVIVEALASGLPVVTLETFGPEAVVHGYNGFIAKDEYDIYDMVKELLEDDDMYAKMKKNTVNSIKKYSGKEGVKEFHNFITKL